MPEPPVASVSEVSAAGAVPVQIAWLASIVPASSAGPTLTRTIVELEQPAADTPVMVYSVATAGLALTVAPVVADKPVAGLQL